MLKNLFALGVFLLVLPSLAEAKDVRPGELYRLTAGEVTLSCDSPEYVYDILDGIERERTLLGLRLLNFPAVKDGLYYAVDADLRIPHEASRHCALLGVRSEDGKHAVVEGSVGLVTSLISDRTMHGAQVHVIQLSASADTQYPVGTIRYLWVVNEK